jgi:hypothetical protein
MNSMAGFIRRLSQLESFLERGVLEDLKLKEESSDMTPFAQTPPCKDGKHVRPLSTSISQHYIYGQLSYIQELKGNPKNFLFYLPILMPVSLRTMVKVKCC